MQAQPSRHFVKAIDDVVTHEYPALALIELMGVVAIEGILGNGVHDPTDPFGN